MTTYTHQRPTITAATHSPWQGLPLQRKCACGGSAAGVTGECSACQREKALGLQTKLAVGARDDPLERGADRIAARVMGMASAVAPVDAGRAAPPGHVARSTPPITTGTVGPTASGGEAPAIVGEVLSGPGQPLDAATRQFMEPRFGHDFGDVRVHTAPRAAASAEAVVSRAYTVGHDIAFAAGAYRPVTHDGRRLLAHELAHTLQQGAGTRLRRQDKNASTANIDWSERESGAVSASSQSLPAVREKALGALRASEMALRAAIDSRNNGNGIPKAISDALAASFPGESESFLDLLLRRIELVQRIVPDVRIYHVRMPTASADIDPKSDISLHNAALANYPDCPAAAFPQYKYIATFPAWDRSEKYQPTILIHECFHYYFAEMVGHSTEKPTINPAAYHSFIATIAGLDAGGSNLSCDIDASRHPVIPPEGVLAHVPRFILGLPPDTGHAADTGDMSNGGVEAR